MYQDARSAAFIPTAEILFLIIYSSHIWMHWPAQHFLASCISSSVQVVAIRRGRRPKAKQVMKTIMILACFDAL